MNKNTNNTIYILGNGNEYDVPYTLGVFTDLAALKDAIIMAAKPIRHSLQYIPHYFSCEEEIYEAKEDIECDKNCAECKSFISREKYEQEIEDAIEGLHFPHDNIFVTVYTINAMPSEMVIDDGYEPVSFIIPAESVTYRLFPVKDVPIIDGRREIHYVRELFDGEEIFNLFEGPLSDLERERKEKKNE